LLVYEYLEKGSLDHALFGTHSVDWRSHKSENLGLV
jgi:hypothetical protein